MPPPDQPVPEQPTSDEKCAVCGMRYGLHSAAGAQCAAPGYEGWSDPPTYFCAMTPPTRPPEGSGNHECPDCGQLLNADNEDFFGPHECAPTPPSTAPDHDVIRERLKRRHDWGAVTVTMDVDEVRALLSALDEERRRGERLEVALEYVSRGSDGCAAYARHALEER